VHGTTLDQEISSVLGAEDQAAFNEELCSCDWTREHACPGEATPGSGKPAYATPDGSECFHYCCPKVKSSPRYCESPWTS